jgi:hypothetical protein
MMEDSLGSRLGWVVRFFAPVLSVILLASLLALIMTLSGLEVQAQVFVADEGSGAAGAAGAGFGNALLFFVPAIIGSFFIIFLLKSGRKKLLKNVFRVLFSFTTGVILFVFIYYLIGLLLDNVWWILANPYDPGTSFITVNGDLFSLLMFFILSMIVGYVLTSMVFSRIFRRKERNRALIAISALMGSFIAVIMPTWTVLLLLILLALWDIYAVFKGPIKEMVEMDMNGNLMARWDPLGDESEQFPFQNMTYDSGTWQLGIGDLVFYSALGAHSLFYSIPYVRTEGNWMMPFFFVPVVIAILVGFAYTIYRLEHSGGDSILPGLPIPMFLGVGVFSIMMLIARYLL